jgi:hypothetical protein
MLIELGPKRAAVHFAFSPNEFHLPGTPNRRSQSTISAFTRVEKRGPRAENKAVTDTTFIGFRGPKALKGQMGLWATFTRYVAEGFGYALARASAPPDVEMTRHRFWK